MTHEAFVKPGDTIDTFLPSFWTRQVATAENEPPDFKHPTLPLARIKKVMKSDPDVKMISADAPILFAKACEMFISEVTARAWIVAESNKRRTLSRADISRAVSQSDQFDFLIDIVPREEGSSHRAGPPASTAKSAPAAPLKEDRVVPPNNEEELLQQQDYPEQVEYAQVSVPLPEQPVQPHPSQVLHDAAMQPQSRSAIRPPPPPPSNQDETNVFYHQIQTYLHAPHPPSHHLPPHQPARDAPQSSTLSPPLR